jgi:hypothetical protein
MSDQNLSPEDKRFLDQHRDKLSESTLRARWINAPDQHEERNGQTLATRSHAVIEQWANERGGQPATVAGTEHGGRPGVLRFIFQQPDDSKLQKISWDDWFKSFDSRDLVFIYQEHKSDGHQSNFFRLDNPNREDG